MSLSTKAIVTLAGIPARGNKGTTTGARYPLPATWG